jgi:CRP-like cAMP-binding protein
MPLRTFGEDSLFGELALIDAAPRSATAIAKSPVTLIPIGRETFNKQLEALDPFMRKVIVMLVSDLRDTTDVAVRKAAQAAKPVNATE